MENKSPIVICVAPNGARKTKSDHSALPISPDEIAVEAENCLRAGASMIHLHVRDEEDKHTIAAKYYRPAIEAIRNRIGNKLIIQVTTEAVGIYSPVEQMQMVRELKPEAVSLAMKELCPVGGEEEAKSFFSWVMTNNIAAQYILYSVEDIKRFIQLHKNGTIPDTKPHILLVLGRYSESLTSEPEDLLPMLEALSGFSVNWAVCAFGAKEADCVSLAAQHGGHARIGFENNMHLPDGEVASDNAALIQNFSAAISSLDREIASSNEARRILGMNELGRNK